METQSRIPRSAAIMAVILFASAVGTLPPRAGGPVKPAMTRLPEFSLKDVDGKEWTNAQFRGKALVIDFWATWCNTCKETIPKLAELNEKYKNGGLTIIGISVDKGSAEKIRKAGKKLGINYLVLLDKENTLGKSFGFNGIPSLYIFDKHGDLKTAMPGYDPAQEGELVAAAEKAMH
ncbi:MAG: thiol-disulfide oxidoreductase [Fibrobacteres bacterium]|nr:thiol-disulfide oxidoreductase [Fibrobacterota bacterium]